MIILSIFHHLSHLHQPPSFTHHLLHTIFHIFVNHPLSPTIFYTHHLSYTIFYTHFHTPSFTHHLLHTLSHTIFHTPSFTHTFTHHLSHTISQTPSLTHIFINQHLSHTIFYTHHLSHTILSHTLFHTQFSHIPSFTHNFVTHTIFLCHTPSFTYNYITHTILFYFSILHHLLCLSFFPCPRYNIWCSLLEEITLWDYPAL